MFRKPINNSNNNNFRTSPQKSFDSTCRDTASSIECLDFLKNANYQCTKMPINEQKQCQRTCHSCKPNPEKTENSIQVDTSKKLAPSVEISSSDENDEFDLDFDTMTPILSSAPDLETQTIGQPTQPNKNKDSRDPSSSQFWPALSNLNQSGHTIALWLVIVIIVSIVLVFIFLAICIFKCHTIYMKYKHKQEMKELHRELTNNMELSKACGQSTINTTGSALTRLTNDSRVGLAANSSQMDTIPKLNHQKLKTAACLSVNPNVAASNHLGVQGPIPSGANNNNNAAAVGAKTNKSLLKAYNSKMPRHLSLKVQHSNLSVAHRSLIEQISKFSEKRPLDVCESGMTDFLNEMKHTIVHQQLSLESQYEHINMVIESIRQRANHKEKLEADSKENSGGAPERPPDPKTNVKSKSANDLKKQEKDKKSKTTTATATTPKSPAAIRTKNFVNPKNIDQTKNETIKVGKNEPTPMVQLSLNGINPNTMNNNKSGAVTEIPMKNLAFVGDDQSQEKIAMNAVSKTKHSEDSSDSGPEDVRKDLEPIDIPNMDVVRNVHD